MANQVEKLSTIAIADIEKVNTLTDDNIEKINTLEFAGVPLFAFVISSNENNWSLDAELSAAGYSSGEIDITITIDSGVLVGTASTGTAGMILQAQEGASTISLTNNGTISGAGGAGGNGGAAGYSAPTIGQSGGTALSVAHATTLVNNGEMRGGGGGGGGGAGATHGGTCSGQVNGAGGGGGTGYGNSANTNGSSGSNSTGGGTGGNDCPYRALSATGGNGGNGGGKGAAGSTGGNGSTIGGTGTSSTTTYTGRAGGGAGDWVSGHSFLTIDTAGTTFGGTSG